MWNTVHHLKENLQSLTNHILQQLVKTYSDHIKEEQLAAKATNYRLICHQLQQTFSTLSPPLQWAMTLAQEKGTNGHTTLQITEFSFALHKGAFRDMVDCAS